MAALLAQLFQSGVEKAYPVIWVFGRPGAGKTTLGLKLADQLSRPRHPSVFMDSDGMRDGLCKGLGYSWEDRWENCRRLAECAKVVCQVAPVVVAAVTPDWRMRKMVKQVIPEMKMVYLHCSELVAESRGKPLWHGTSFDYVTPQEEGTILVNGEEEINLSEILS